MTALPLGSVPDRQPIHCTPNFPRDKINKSLRVIDLTAPKPTSFSVQPCETPSQLSRQPSIQVLAESQTGPECGEDELESFMEGVVSPQPDREEYLRVWFENMALREKVKRG